MSDVKASVALTSDGRLQGFIGGSAANLGQAAPPMPAKKIGYSIPKVWQILLFFIIKVS